MNPKIYNIYNKYKRYDIERDFYSFNKDDGMTTKFQYLADAVEKEYDDDTEWNRVPANDDRWNELKDLMENHAGTPMEKLAAIERFVETH